nr:LLM class flavin-dependent oxidoreductase [Cohnella abietis]
MLDQGRRQLHLGAFTNYVGHHMAAWRYPQADTTSSLKFDFYKRIAQSAERGKFDMLFLGDSLYTETENLYKHHTTARLEPLTILASLLAVTDYIGLGATVSTSFNEPYNVARKLATLDHLSNGRAAWNVVTSSNDKEAQNYNRQKHYQHDFRYERAAEFLDVVKRLWNSWEEDALIMDKESGVYADLDKLHPINHTGVHFTVKGPLNIPRSMQGHPVVMQAGLSHRARQFAVREAEVLFTIASSIEKSKQDYAEIKGQLSLFGRAPKDLKIMPGLLAIVGKTQKEAEDKERELQQLVIPEFAVRLLSNQLNVDLSGYPLDGPLPALSDVAHFNGEKGRYEHFLALAQKENLTIRQLSLRLTRGHGHLTMTGTPSVIAEQMAEWFASEACDGFNVMFPYLPGALDDFVHEVIPILQERGIYRTEYTGTTLRSHLND